MEMPACASERASHPLRLRLPAQTKATTTRDRPDLLQKKSFGTCRQLPARKTPLVPGQKLPFQGLPLAGKDCLFKGCHWLTRFISLVHLHSSYLRWITPSFVGVHQFLLLYGSISPFLGLPLAGKDSLFKGCHWLARFFILLYSSDLRSVPLVCINSYCYTRVFCLFSTLR